MARISPAVIDRVRDSADILDVVSGVVDMKRRGRNYFGLCPFHQEKTPSFSVAPDKGIYHCFGCGVGGNSINFIMEHEKLSFVEAVRQLGDKFGVPVEFEEASGSKEFFTAMYGIHESAAALYHQDLFSKRGAAALKYLKERGLHEDSLKKFMVGFTPERDDFLLKKVQDSYTEEVLERSGLFNRGERGFYDRFRSRIMFPISNTAGKVIAFGGRIFGSDDPAKYMNSPETPLYRKSDVLYGLNQAREAILQEKHALLVEGYTDLLQVVQAGIKNIVAVAGTALTENHANALSKITRKVYVVYDGDEAGIKAAIRGGYMLLRGGLEPAMVSLPNDSDPDDWVQEKGIEPLKQAVSEAGPLLNFHLDDVRLKEMSAAERSETVREILREATGIGDAIVRDDFLKSLAAAVNLDDSEIIRMFRAQTRRRAGTSAPPPEISTEPELFTLVTEKAQAAIVKVLAAPTRGLIQTAAELVDLELFSDSLLKKLAGFILENKSEINIPTLLDQLESKQEKEKASALFMEEMTLIDPEQVLEDCMRTLKSQPLKERIKAARLKLRELEAAGQDGSGALDEITKLQKELDSL